TGRAPSDPGRLAAARLGVPGGRAAPPRRDGAAAGPAGGAAVGDAADDGDEARGAPPPRQPLRAYLTGASARHLRATLGGGPGRPGSKGRSSSGGGCNERRA